MLSFGSQLRLFTQRVPVLSQLTQVCDFSKYISKSRAKRLPLTTKRVGRGYYKGNRCRKEGTISRKGHFRLEKDRLLELVVPDLSNFTLKPYIAPGAKRNVIDAVVKG